MLSDLRIDMFYENLKGKKFADFLNYMSGTACKMQIIIHIVKKFNSWCEKVNFL